MLFRHDLTNQVGASSSGSRSAASRSRLHTASKGQSRARAIRSMRKEPHGLRPDDAEFSTAVGSGSDECMYNGRVSDTYGENCINKTTEWTVLETKRDLPIMGKDTMHAE